MALMRAEIDKRTLAGLASQGTVQYAHGLRGIPDAVFIRFITAATATTLWVGKRAVVDATNVTIDNDGGAAGPNMEVCTVRFHSVIQ